MTCFEITQLVLAWKKIAVQLWQVIYNACRYTLSKTNFLPWAVWLSYANLLNRYQPKQSFYTQSSWTLAFCGPLPLAAVFWSPANRIRWAKAVGTLAVLFRHGTYTSFVISTTGTYCCIWHFAHNSNHILSGVIILGYNSKWVLKIIRGGKSKTIHNI